MSDERRSRIYGWAQTSIFCAFAGAILFDRSPRLFDGGPAVRALGGAVAIAGVLLLLTAVWTLRQSIQIEPQPKADGALTTHGVYAWFRHPVYSSIVCVAVGLFLRQPTPVAAGAAAAVIVFLLLKVGFEERLLAARYAGYAEYRRRTWGVITPAARAWGSGWRRASRGRLRRTARRPATGRRRP